MSSGTMQGVPLLGYLVAYRVRECAVSVEDYAGLLDGLEAEFGKARVDLLRIPRRRAIDAWQAAVRRVGRKRDDRRAEVRYLFRVERGGKAAGVRFLVKEEFPGGDRRARPYHTVLGTVRFDAAARSIQTGYADGLPEALREEAEAVFAELRQTYEHEAAHFPSSALRCRFARLVADCVPVSYDAEHRFKFVSIDHAPVVELLRRVAAWLNARAGASCRSESTHVAALPLPDVDEIRRAVADAYVAEMGDEERAVQEAIEAYTTRAPGERDPKELVKLLARIRSAQEMARKYEQEFRVAAGAAKLGLSRLQQQARVLLGGDERPDDSRHTLSWPTARLRLFGEQQALGDALIAVPGAYPLVRDHGEVISWRAGSSAGRALIAQTRLADRDRVHITLLVPEAETPWGKRGAPAPDQGIGWARSISGWTYTGTAATVLRDIMDWWREMCAAGKEAM